MELVIEKFEGDISKGIRKSVKTATSDAPFTLTHWQYPTDQMKKTILFPNIDKVQVEGHPGNVPQIEGLYKSARIRTYLFNQGIDLIKNIRKKDEKSLISYFLRLVGLKTFAIFTLITNLTRLSSKRIFKEEGIIISLEGNDNIFIDDSNYNRTQEVWTLFESILKSYYDKGFRTYRNIFKYHLRSNKKIMSFRPSFSHLEYYVMISSTNHRDDLKTLLLRVGKVLGPANVEVDTNGFPLGTIKYYFKSPELAGAYLKIYSKTQELIKMEITIPMKHFKLKKGSDYKEFNLHEVAHKLRHSSYNVFKKLLAHKKDSLHHEIPYEDCLQKFMSKAGKHSNKILNSLITGAGTMTLKSAQKEYRNILRLIEDGMIERGGEQSTYTLNPKYINLITRNQDGGTNGK